MQESISINDIEKRKWINCPVIFDIMVLCTVDYGVGDGCCYYLSSVSELVQV